MPPKWPRQPDRRDPDYRRLDDRMNFAFHVAVFAASNSGLWFFHVLRPQTLLWVQWFTLSWLLLLLGHGVYVFAIASYSEASSADSPPKSSSG
ncbi:MAG: 2TM domain-containing protein [Hormoscilla sp.]